METDIIAMIDYVHRIHISNSLPSAGVITAS